MQVAANQKSNQWSGCFLSPLVHRLFTLHSVVQQVCVCVCICVCLICVFGAEVPQERCQLGLALSFPRPNAKKRSTLLWRLSCLRHTNARWTKYDAKMFVKSMLYHSIACLHAAKKRHDSYNVYLKYIYMLGCPTHDTSHEGTSRRIINLLPQWIYSVHGYMNSKGFLRHAHDYDINI